MLTTNRIPPGLPAPLSRLMAKVDGYLMDESGLDQIQQAFQVSQSLIHDKPTTNGDRPGSHGLTVARILADLHLDPVCIVAGLLHEPVETGLVDAEVIAEHAGAEVMALINALLQLGKASFQGSEVTRAEHMRQMILESTKDLRVILLLLADRLAHLRDHARNPSEAGRALATESQVIFAPIAHRLGIHSIMAELEDLAFQVLDPELFQTLSNGIAGRLGKQRGRVDQINGELQALLQNQDLACEVLGRTKHVYSVHNKMQRNGLEIDQVHDLLATRIIVHSVEECYRVLGLIHARFTPLPGRFKDYIALPKANGYQSLHTQIFGSHGDLFEMQIRTAEMHQQAEMGIASHFSYKDGGSADKGELASISWFRTLLNSLEDGQNPAESMELLERELAPEHIFLFTPSGEVIKLPYGATPIDFAYAIHSEVGDHCVGARVDGRMISIRTPLGNGAVVEILTGSHQHPKEDWLKYSVTSKAQGRIRGSLRQREKEEAIRIGKDGVLREAKRVVRKVEDLFQLDSLQDWLRRHNFNTPEELFAAEGFGRISLKDVLDQLLLAGSEPEPAEKTVSPPKRLRQTTSSSIVVEGMEYVMARFAKCCSPVHGDPLEGIITSGRGISVHHRKCANIRRTAIHPDRLVSVEWNENFKGARPVTLVISAHRSMKEMLAMITSLEEEEKTSVTSGQINSKRGLVTQQLTLMVSDSKQLKRILHRLNNLEGVQADRGLDSV